MRAGRRYATHGVNPSNELHPSSDKYPDLAIIFDNLHSLHDVVSDVLASPTLRRGQKRAAILQAPARYRDSTSFTTTREEWRSVSRELGAVDTLAIEPAPPSWR